MKKYIISIVSDRYAKDVIGGGASAKAPADVITLAKEAGYEEIVLKINAATGKIIQNLSLIFQLHKVSKQIEKGSEVFFQYPNINPSIMPLVMPMFRSFKKTAIIHDMNSVRVAGCLSSTEKRALSYFDKLHVHSENMKTFLADKLDKRIEYRVIGCFPYIAAPNEEDRKASKQVVFAGNLDKSKFLQSFIYCDSPLDIFLYGQTKNEYSFVGRADYLGRFMPDDIQHLKGSWGLVWDGESSETCSGYYGEYLKIIAPHKFSMYIAADLPVIVWKKSAMAPLVEKYGVGVTVDSLQNVDKEISKYMNGSSYDEMVNNVRCFAKQMMKPGNMFNDEK